MQLFRVFDWDGTSLGRATGGPLSVARHRQGAGRHDAPARYGAWYCSRDAVSAIAEAIQFFRGHTVTDADFERAGAMRKAIVELVADDGLALVDLDDPRDLLRRHLRPSQVATLRRTVTQRIAVGIFDEGASGLEWWSALEAEWRNVTLFHERALAHINVVAEPQLLSVRLPVVRDAADRLGITVG